MLLMQVSKFFDIGGLHCCYVGVQNKRKFVHIVCIKMAVLTVPEEKYLIVAVLKTIYA